MAERKNIPEARNRILQAAIKIFAEKSFEGSRIEEIAKEAKVPKSLIYYHFKSKDEIYNVLVKNFIDEYTNIIRASEDDSNEKMAEEMSNKIGGKYKAFAEANADLIRIILIDSLKKSTEKPLIYKIVETMIETEKKSSQINNPNDYDEGERLIAEFFTGVIPLFSYICFKTSWLNYFNIQEKEFNKFFLKVMTNSHIEYHKTHQ